MSSQDSLSNFPPIHEAIKLSSYLICDRPASEIRSHLNELIHSINRQLSSSITIPKRRTSLSAKSSSTATSPGIPRRTPTTPRSPLTPTTPTRAIKYTSSLNSSVSNNYYWATLYVYTKMCLMDLEYWEKGVGHPADRISDSFSTHPKLLLAYREIKTMNQKKIIENILTDLGKIQEVVLGRIARMKSSK